MKASIIRNDVPHCLWGKKPEAFMNEMTTTYGVPRKAAAGHPETRYRDRRKMLAGPKP